jgi:Ca2+-binding RTX toxin-like protein
MSINIDIDVLGRGKKDGYKDNNKDYGKDENKGKDKDDNNKDYGKDESKDKDKGHGNYGKDNGNDKGYGKDHDDKEDHDRYADHNKSHYGKYIVGTKGNDYLKGGKGNDFIDGRRGDDKLYGNDGNDKLYGGRGDDYLVGGRGNDFIDGGRGEDTIVFSGVTKWSNGYDKIDGFKSGEDTLQFSLNDVKHATHDYHLHKGPLDEDNFASNWSGSARGHDDYFVYNERTGVLSFDADGKGGHDATALAQLVGHPHLEASDISLAWG